MSQVTSAVKVRSIVKVKAADPESVQNALNQLQMRGILFEKPVMVLSTKRQDANLIAHVIADSMEMLGVLISLIKGMIGVQSVSKMPRPVPA